MKAALRLTGLTADTLRVWERRYGAVRPRRSESGRRLYSDQEVNRLRLLADLVRLGFSIGEIAERPDQELVARLAEARMHDGGSSPVRQSVSEHVERLLSAVHDFNLSQLKLALARVRFVCSPRDFAFYLVPQLMREVGLRIDQGQFDISQEHALSDLVRHQLREIYEELEPVSGAAPEGHVMIFSAPEGQYHDLGLLLAAISCRYRGIRTHFLGANLPAASLAQGAKELKATAVVVSLSYVIPGEGIPVQTFLMELDRRLPKSISVWLGGSGVEAIRRHKLQRDSWIFESLEALEQKLDLLLGVPISDRRS